MSERREPVEHVTCDGKGCASVVVNVPDDWVRLAPSWHEKVDLCPACAEKRRQRRAA